MTRPRRPRVAYRLLCLLMAWVMVAAPLLVLAGEVHELEHAHSTAGIATEVSILPADSPDVGLMHDVADATHCCGHSVAMLPGSPALLLSPPACEAQAWTAAVRDRRLAFLPFRPPIRT